MANNDSYRQIQQQILWNRLIAVVEEQAQALIRTAFSSTVREAGDLSAGVFHPDGRMLAQAITGTPGHVNAMAASVNYFIEKFPVSEMKPGDVLFTNDPWHGTGHLHDFTMVTPTFKDTRPVALFASTCHVVDIGGIGFGPDGREVFEEGINIPMTYFAEAGTIDQRLIELIKANVREPLQVEGDLYALASCNDAGSRRLLDMMREYALEDLHALGEHIISSSRNAMLDEIRKLPQGTYRNRMRTDGYDNPIDLVAQMIVHDDGIDVDFSGSSPVSSKGINVPITYTQAYASFGVRCLVGSSIPNNTGSLNPIKVWAPKGSVLNAPRPCPVAARHVIGQMLPDVVLGCLHQALGTRAPAEGTSSLWNPTLMGRCARPGTNEENEPKTFTLNVFHSGGTGARYNKDGMSATAFPSGVRNTPVEVTELIAPLIVWKKEYRTDSGGAGHHRGGLGQIMEIGHAHADGFSVSAMFDRIRFAARGRNGGKDGQTGAVLLASGGKLRAKGRQDIPQGDHLIMEMPGGGGYGDPLQREMERVLSDVRDGLISKDTARRDYGVVINDHDEIDFDRSKKLRGKGTRSGSRSTK
ncbi:MAG: hydantoinase B/oxoprolinase family protein [Gammaproteobacteria bacterium]|nr:hydantoinase B/oxoprolinase family protein [Gammaproteobacteria bacterium]